ncbi:uncharacterized protein TRUGW13939_09950 [Talaromyces rugulosus]|uniref:D-xylose reductase [NAD(P)H] n=1 Tax=Talaromyces rugulosus TaxID=121627 RepID=A0A7H8RBD6_TALRU|nr:uncharacterized protein TRUGW13939_09950 [Talaromyces rugulosus]QKX62785.1 hypothetical protein TRUGW13939_09950 [Talaromyces rugulosus]
MASGRKFHLNNGLAIPALGFGTWKSAPNDAYSSVLEAFKTGYRHIDCAWIYGNESEVGRALKDSGLKREEYFLTTKLWSTYHERVEENLDLSLKQLGVEYLDLYLLHWPVTLNPNGNPPTFPLLPDGTRDVILDHPFTKTWESMERLLATGKVKAIGVSNFDIHNLEVLRRSSKVVPAVNQVELHPYLQQDRLLEYCKQRGIVLTAYTPLGSNDTPLKEEKIITEIAEKHNCQAAQVLLNWGIQRGYAVLTKSVTPSRISANFQDVSLDAEDMSRIKTLEKGLRTCNPPWKTTVFHDE